MFAKRFWTVQATTCYEFCYCVLSLDVFSAQVFKCVCEFSITEDLRFPSECRTASFAQHGMYFIYETSLQIHLVLCYYCDLSFLHNYI